MSTGPARAALLLLADGRLPAGAYAHSAGLEPAVHDGHVRDLDDVESFARGRLETAGLVAATFAAAACHAVAAGDSSRLASLDEGLDARMPSPTARATSRQLGRQLVRVVARMRQDARLGWLPRAPHQPLALGTACAVFDLEPRDAALAVLHDTVSGVFAAAVRLLSLDPLASHERLARCAQRVDEVAGEADRGAGDDVADLPACAAPLLDLLAEHHGARTGRLFAS